MNDWITSLDKLEKQKWDGKRHCYCTSNTSGSYYVGNYTYDEVRTGFHRKTLRGVWFLPSPPPMKVIPDWIDVVANAIYSNRAFWDAETIAEEILEAQPEQPCLECGKDTKAPRFCCNACANNYACDDEHK